jgi:hypothetical protein
VLARLAEEFGVTPATEADMLPTWSSRRHGVPYFQFNADVVVEGAQPPALLLKAMQSALTMAA